MWPRSGKGRIFPYYNGKEASNRLELRNAQHESVLKSYDVAQQNLQTMSEQARDGFAMSWSELRCMESRTLLDDLVYTSDVNEQKYGVVGSRNGSSACDQKVDIEIISGYLARRYEYNGNTD